MRRVVILGAVIFAASLIRAQSCTPNSGAQTVAVSITDSGFASCTIPVSVTCTVGDVCGSVAITVTNNMSRAFVWTATYFPCAEQIGCAGLWNTVRWDGWPHSDPKVNIAPAHTQPYSNVTGRNGLNQQALAGVTNNCVQFIVGLEAGDTGMNCGSGAGSTLVYQRSIPINGTATFTASLRIPNVNGITGAPTVPGSVSGNIYIQIDQGADYGWLCMGDGATCHNGATDTVIRNNIKAQITLTGTSTAFVDRTITYPTGCSAGTIWTCHTVDTTWKNPGTWAVIPVANTTALNSAIASLACGQVIQLTHGVTYGPIAATIPSLACDDSHQDYFTTDLVDPVTGHTTNAALFPDFGNRATASNVAGMPTVLMGSTSANAAFALANGANHVKFTGLNITVVCPTTNDQLMMNLFNATPGVTPRPDDIGIDRSYIHWCANDYGGSGPAGGVAMMGTRMYVVDSTIGPFIGHNGTEIQAIQSTAGVGPYDFENSQFLSTGENSFFGGGDPDVVGELMSDILIRGNLYIHPMSWVPGCVEVGTLGPTSLPAQCQGAYWAGMESPVQPKRYLGLYSNITTYLPGDVIHTGTPYVRWICISNTNCPAGSTVTEGASWHQGTGNMKNCFEMKGSNRALILGNYFGPQWSEAQTGSCPVFEVANQSGSNPTTANRDISFIYNIVQHVNECWVTVPSSYAYPSQFTKFINISNNICFDVSGPPWDDGSGVVGTGVNSPGAPSYFNEGGGLNVTIINSIGGYHEDTNHNTIVCQNKINQSAVPNSGPGTGCYSIFAFDSTDPTSVVLGEQQLQYNIFDGNGIYGFNMAAFSGCGTCVSGQGNNYSGSNPLRDSGRFIGYPWNPNVITQFGDPAAYSFYIAPVFDQIAGVLPTRVQMQYVNSSDFVNFSSWALQRSSPFAAGQSQQAGDGTDMGAPIATITANTTCVISGQCAGGTPPPSGDIIKPGTKFVGGIIKGGNQ